MVQTIPALLLLQLATLHWLLLACWPLDVTATPPFGETLAWTCVVGAVKLGEIVDAFMSSEALDRAACTLSVLRARL